MRSNASSISRDGSKTRESFGNISNSIYYSPRTDTPFSPPIKVQNFQFYNYDSPYTRASSKSISHTPKIPKQVINSKFTMAVTSTPNKSDSDFETSIRPIINKKKIFKCRSSECVFLQNKPVRLSLGSVKEGADDQRLTWSLPGEGAEIVVDKFEYHIERTVNNEELSRSSVDDIEQCLERQIMTNIFVQTSPHESLMSELNHAVTVSICCMDY